MVVTVDERRPQAKKEVQVQKRDEDFLDLIGQLDKFSDLKHQPEKERKGRLIIVIYMYFTYHMNHKVWEAENIHVTHSSFV